MHDGCAPINAHGYEVDIHPSYAAVFARVYSRIGTICHPIHDFFFFRSQYGQLAGKKIYDLVVFLEKACELTTAY